MHPNLYQFIIDFIILNSNYNELLDTNILIQKAFDKNEFGIIFLQNIDTNLIKTNNPNYIIGIEDNNKINYLTEKEYFTIKENNFKYSMKCFVQTSEINNNFVCSTVKEILYKLNSIESIYGIGGASGQYSYIETSKDVKHQYKTNSKWIHQNNLINNLNSILVDQYNHINFLEPEYNIYIINIGKKGLRNLREIFKGNKIPEHVIYIGCTKSYVDEDISFFLNNHLYQINFHKSVNNIQIFYLRKITHVSLGFDCSIAYNLRKYSLRQEAYPFDFIKTKNLTKLVNCLENDFKNFNPTQFDSNITTKYLNLSIMKPSDYIIAKNEYNMHFVHDFSSNNKIQVIKKYQRRINRFRNLNNKNIYFYRIIEKIKPTTNNDILRLIHSLKNIYKIDSFTVICIVLSQQKLVNHPNLKVHYQDNSFSPKSNLPWARESYDWKKIFSPI